MKLPTPPTTRLDGKCALVTGASSGIGLGCAVALADRGAHVVCAARGGDRLAEAVAAMKGKGYAAEALTLDIADLDAMAAALDAQNPFDIVVNSAGMARHGPATATTPADFDAVMAVNLRGAYFLSARTAQAMQSAGIRGSIIHISSQMGHVGGIDRAVYCASKHALEGMVKAMAIEWGPHGIRINTLCPTFIRTPLGDVTLRDAEKRAWIEGMIKLGRVGEVEDIMGGVAYLASDASALVTGTALMIDGGWTAH
ncbi:2-deoxy-D-gluconate 3-dehydrogenase [Loktanella atrilutea]|uniref:2-deoxy-D-gluconate 3-dehydrogenase n=1 Tax=Loktanella atrilutea TaxID=366533 RepID=A0A1M5DBH4_LOKAT|nr:SDR family oxidoreductase [Loktanella atrilutea]SHF64281.1 2-deoxy-D-gluconate 3-dehydrogenase [Loktanella atrilutea]